MTASWPVSVVMSVYNCEKYLSAAIGSVLGQTFRNFEFIIINDGSTDNSAAVIKSYRDSRIKVIEQNNSGLAAALNTGINISVGKYIARMDGDDICLPQRFEKQFEFLEQNPDHVLAGSNAAVIDQSGQFIYNSEHPCDWPDIKKTLPFPPIFHSSVMMQRAAVLKCGKYNETASKLNDFEDLLLWNRLVQYGKFANLPDRLIQYRLLPSSSTTKIGKLSRLKRELITAAIRTGTVPAERGALYLRLKNNLTSREREHLYHKYLAKKYLFENFQPGQVRKNIFKAMQLKFPDPEITAMLGLSFLPATAVKYLYHLFGKR
jgi:glycosyltransferase involved in cell wall biosynthesis